VRFYYRIGQRYRKTS